MRASLLASATTATLRSPARAARPATRQRVRLLGQVRQRGASAVNEAGRYLLPSLLIPSSRGTPPVEHCLGTRPSQAAVAAGLEGPAAAAMAATNAVAIVAGDLDQPPAGFVLPRGYHGLGYAQVERAPLGLQICHQMPHPRRQASCLIRQDLGQRCWSGGPAASLCRLGHPALG